MTKSKGTKRALLSSVVALFLCFSMLLGTTFAWFTDTVTSANNIIQSGTLDVVLEYKNNWSDEWAPVDENTKIFKEGVLYEPGYTEVVYLRVSNAGSLALKYQLSFNITQDKGSKNVYGEDFKLSEYLKVGTYVQDEYSSGFNYADLLMPTMFGTRQAALNSVKLSAISSADAVIRNDAPVLPGTETAQVIAIVLTMPEEVGNEANTQPGATAPWIELGVRLYATQYTHEEDSFDNQYDADSEYEIPEDLADSWDGSADTSWYDPANPQTSYELSTAEQLAGLAELVSGVTTFKGVTFTLTNDIDLFCEDTTASADGDPLTFRPIGDHSKDGTFEGTFDGNGKTISNLYQNGWDLGYEWGVYGSYGLFGNINDATIKNLTITGSESYIEGGDTSFVAGSATGTCVFENITIKDSISATYNNGNGGIIGWSGAGNYTFKNITIEEDCVLAGLWGSFDSSIGGVVGQGEPGATYNFENVNVACRIDAYNDCTASYDYYNYRMCGMLIGRLEETTTIDGTNYPDTSKYNITCTNVTVTYDDWANYHYCRATGARAVRVEAGYSYDGLAADYDHTACTAHHMELIAFDQIFGGDQYGVKGLPSYDGVTVVYNNK